MKISAVVRIVIWSIVAIICYGVLSAGLHGQGQLFSWLNSSFKAGGYGYSNSDKYAEGGGSVASADIQSVEIKWIAGSVEVAPYDGGMIQFDEEISGVGGEKYAMRYLAENGKLVIQFGPPHRDLRFFQKYRKSLTVKIPYDLALRDFKVNSVSADIRLEGVRAHNLDVKSVSGSMSLEDTGGDTMTLANVSGHINVGYKDTTASELRAKTVSGHINVEAKAVMAKLNTVSGSVKLYAGEDVKDVDIGTVSGGITLGLPENDGFNARYSSVSGRFNSEFPVEMSGKHGIYKNGGIEISLGTVSGGIKIARR